MEYGTSLFSAVLENKTQSNGLKLQERTFQRNKRKKFVIVATIQHWNGLIVLVGGGFSSTGSVLKKGWMTTWQGLPAWARGWIQ